MKVIEIHMSFASSWFYEFEFSVAEAKSKQRVRIFNDETGTYLATLDPRFDLICPRKQVEPSN